ncbi:MAG TPA: DUF2116 family Zn-ribbon domain-containing protein [Bacteroidales bacterium]|nr:DUF2116 family Zn-ribbon domain-containing protein [Bacteroidales bacterium]
MTALLFCDCKCKHVFNKRQRKERKRFIFMNKHVLIALFLSFYT